ncbi:MAG: hypothetical protein KIT73_10685 [Burkholderiales bacterium]|nr:hypothetical protein [Burkholderiales bacterium]
MDPGSQGAATARLKTTMRPASARLFSKNGIGIMVSLALSSSVFNRWLQMPPGGRAHSLRRLSDGGGSLRRFDRGVRELPVDLFRGERRT